jgi:hypothetical protein
MLRWRVWRGRFEDGVGGLMGTEGKVLNLIRSDFSPASARPRRILVASLSETLGYVHSTSGAIARSTVSLLYRDRLEDPARIAVI